MWELKQEEKDTPVNLCLVSQEPTTHVLDFIGTKSSIKSLKRIFFPLGTLYSLGLSSYSELLLGFLELIIIQTGVFSNICSYYKHNLFCQKQTKIDVYKIWKVMEKVSGKGSSLFHLMLEQVSTSEKHIRRKKSRECKDFAQSIFQLWSSVPQQ